MAAPAAYDDLDLEPLDSSGGSDALDLEPLDLEPVSDPRAERRRKLQEKRAQPEQVEGDTGDKYLAAFSQGINRGMEGAARLSGRLLQMVMPDVKVPEAMGPYEQPFTRAGRRLALPFTALRETAQTIREGTKGSDTGAAVAEGVGSIGPTMLGSVIPGGGIAMSALTSGGASYLDALEDFKRKGLDDAKAEQASALYGTLRGAITGVVTKWMPEALSRLPGRAGELLGHGGVEDWTKVSAAALRPGIKSALQKTVGSGIGEGIEEATDQAVGSIVDKLTLRPDLTPEQVAKETAFAFALGTVIGTGVRAPMEAARTLSGEDRRQGLLARMRERREERFQKQLPGIQSGLQAQTQAQAALERDAAAAEQAAMNPPLVVQERNEIKLNAQPQQTIEEFRSTLTNMSDELSQKPKRTQLEDEILKVIQTETNFPALAQRFGIQIIELEPAAIAPVEPTPPAPTPVPKPKEAEPVKRVTQESDSLIEDVKAQLTPQGDTERAGDYWTDRFQKASIPEVIDFLRWTRTEEATPWVKRFIGANAADVLRSKNVPVDSLQWQFDNLTQPPAPNADPIPRPAPLPSVPAPGPAPQVEQGSPAPIPTPPRARQEIKGQPVASPSKGYAVTYDADTRTVTVSDASGDVVGAVNPFKGRNPPDSRILRQGKINKAAKRIINEHKRSIRTVTAQEDAAPKPASTKPRLEYDPDRPPDVLDNMLGLGIKIQRHTSASPGTEGYYGTAYRELRGLTSDRESKRIAYQVRKFFPESGGVTPDDALEALRRAGHMKPDATVDDLWDAMRAAALQRIAYATGADADTQVLDAQMAEHEVRVREMQEALQSGLTQFVDVPAFWHGSTLYTIGQNYTVNAMGELLPVPGGLRAGQFWPKLDQADKSGDRMGSTKPAANGLEEFRESQVADTVDDAQLPDAPVDFALESSPQVQAVPKPSGGNLFGEAEMPFNLSGEQATGTAPAPVAAASTGTQPELFAVQQVTEAKDPVKSADAVQALAGGDALAAAATLERQLGVVDADPKTKKAFTKEQRTRLRDVITLLKERAMKAMFPSGRIEAWTDMDTGRSYVSPDTPVTRHAALWWHEVAVHGGLEYSAKTLEQRQELESLLEAAATMLDAEADMLVRAGGFSSAAAMAERYGFDLSTPEGLFKYRLELLARQAEQLAGKPKPGWWRELIGRLQLWVAKHFKINLTESGVEALIRVGAERMRGATLETRVVGQMNPDADVGISYSIVATPKDLESATQFDPQMPAQEQRDNTIPLWLQNAASVGMMRSEFDALPSEVQGLLTPIRQRLETEEAAREKLGTVPTGATLRQTVEAAFPDSQPDQMAAFFQTAENILSVRDFHREFPVKLAQAQAEVNAALKAAPQQADLIEQVKQRIVSDNTDALLVRQAQALEQNRLLDAKTAFDQVKYLRAKDGAIAQMTSRLVTQIPDSVLLAPGANRQAVATWLQLNLATVARNVASTEPALVPAFVQMVGDTAGVARLISVAKGLRETDAVTRAKERLATVEAAAGFMDRLYANPQFQDAYQEVLKVIGAGEAVLERFRGRPGKFYPNPYDMENDAAAWFIDPNDVDQATWEKNQDAYDAIENAYRRYIMDPDGDPFTKEGLKRALAEVEVDRNMAFAPEAGRITPERTFNPFYKMLLWFPKFRAIPDFVLATIGGKQAHRLLMLLHNRAIIGDRAQAAHKLHQTEVFLTTVRAAEDAGFTGTPNQKVDQWQRRIGNPIFRSYQSKGDRRYKLGDSIEGHEINASDMRAVKAQKDYANAQMEAVKSAWKGDAEMVSGHYSPLRIFQQIGKTQLEREAVDYTGNLMPRRFVSFWQNFKNEWLAPGADKAALAQRPEYWDAVLSHVQSYSDPDYARLNQSPFFDIYRDISKEIDKTGIKPANLEKLAKMIYDRMINDPEGWPKPVPSNVIKSAFVAEIDSAVRRFDSEWASQRVIVKDDSEVGIVSADNYLNRPRGEQLLPKGFYSYTVSTQEEMAGMQRAPLDIYDHRFLRDAKELLSVLRGKAAAFKQRGLTEKTSQKLVEQGQELLNLRESTRFANLLETITSDVRTRLTTNQIEERDMSSFTNRVRSFFATTLLNRFGPMWRNFLGGTVNRALQEDEMFRFAYNGFYRMWLIHPALATSKAAFEQGTGSMRTLLGLIANSKAGKKGLEKVLATNKQMFAQLSGQIEQFMERESERVARLQASGVMTPSGAWENMVAQWKLMEQSGRITQDLENPSVARKAARRLGSLIELGVEIGAPLELPRAMASHLVDNLVNAEAPRRVNDILKTLHMAAVSSLDNRSALGIQISDRERLSAAELFGYTGKPVKELEAAAAALRGEFAKAGIDLDKYLVDFWRETQRVKGTGVEPRVLTQAQENSLIYQNAARINKATSFNRPIYNDSASRLFFTLMGYGMNQNAQLARFMGRWSRDTRKFRTEALRKALFMVIAMLFAGTILSYYPIRTMKRWLEREDEAIKELSDSESVGDFALTALRQSYGFLPVIGQIANYTLGAVAPGRGNFGSNWSFLPLSLFSSVAEKTSKAIQTGEWALPVVELFRQWIPGSRWIMNRLPIRDGLTNEAAVRAAAAGNAPASLEIKPMAQGSARRYSPISGQIEAIRNALSRSTGPDMGAVNRERAAAIATLVAKGSSPEDAAQAVDEAVLASNPYRTVFGREPTPAERESLINNFDDYQRANARTVEGGRQAYARQFGRKEPDFVSLRGVQRAASGGSATAPGYRSGNRLLRGRQYGGARRFGLRRGTVTPVRGSRRSMRRFWLVRPRRSALRSRRYGRIRSARASISR